MSSLRTAALVLASCLATQGWAAPLRAQTGGSGGEPDASEEPAPRQPDEGERDPMAFLGLTFRLGYSHQNAGSIDNPVYSQALADAAGALSLDALVASGLVGNGGCTPIDRKCRTNSRDGLLLAATLHLGGDGFGWDIEPYLMSASSATALGAYTGPKFDIHLADPLYFGFGFGFKAAYVWADGWQHGADLGGRIPVRFTFYLARHLALVAEGSFGAGVSGYLNEKQQIVDPRTGQPLATVPKMSFGAARVWDVSVGLRFP